MPIKNNFYLRVVAYSLEIQDLMVEIATFSYSLEIIKTLNQSKRIEESAEVINASDEVEIKCSPMSDFIKDIVTKSENTLEEEEKINLLEPNPYLLNSWHGKALCIDPTNSNF